MLNNKNNIAYGKNKGRFWKQMKACEKTKRTILNTGGVQSKTSVISWTQGQFSCKEKSQIVLWTY